MAALEALASMSEGRQKSTLAGGLGETMDYPDLAAAKALLDAGIRIKKLLVSKKAIDPADGRDLFDTPPEQGSAWSFKKA